MNPKAGRSRTAKAAVYLALAIAAALLYVQLTSLFAQPGAQERHSRRGELQTNPRPEAEAPAGAARMEPRRPPQAIPVEGRVEKMEDHLARPPQAPAGERQPVLEPERAADLGRGQGEQKKRVVEAVPPAEASLHLVVQIKADGSAEILSAAEVPGTVILSEEPRGNFVYEVAIGDETLAVEALPDPFEVHSFGGPEGTPQQYHHIEEAKTATIVVNVPRMNLASANLDRLTVRLFKIKPGPPFEKINPAVLRQLKQQDRLERRLDVPPGRLAPGIREKGKKVPE